VREDLGGRTILTAGRLRRRSDFYLARRRHAPSTECCLAYRYRRDERTGVTQVVYGDKTPRQSKTESAVVTVGRGGLNNERSLERSLASALCRSFAT